MGRALGEARLHALVGFEVERQRPLVAVQVLHVVAVPRPAHGLVRIEAGRALDLDHVGPEVGQDARAGRTGAHAGQIEHADKGQSGRWSRPRHWNLVSFDRTLGETYFATAALPARRSRPCRGAAERLRSSLLVSGIVACASLPFLKNL